MSGIGATGTSSLVPFSGAGNRTFLPLAVLVGASALEMSLVKLSYAQYAKPDTSSIFLIIRCNETDESGTRDAVRCV